MDPSVISPEIAEQISQMSQFESIMVGLGLSASAGFRVFVPLLALSIAEHFGVVHLSEGFAWIGEWPAMIMLGTATVVEIVSYFIPWLDNILDTITTPSALLSGTVLAASGLPEMPMHLDWVIAAIGGGGAAGIIQGGTVMTRAASTATSGGLGNPVVATVETVGSILASILIFIIPLIIVSLVILLFVGVFVWWVKRRRKTKGGDGSNGENNIPDPQHTADLSSGT